jgi:hypothetical protein
MTLLIKVYITSNAMWNLKEFMDQQSLSPGTFLLSTFAVESFGHSITCADAWGEPKLTKKNETKIGWVCIQIEHSFLPSRQRKGVSSNIY